jgi:succinate dehydrogenase / fumarate reductase, flavoprotein subunit
VADFLEFAELMCMRRAHREESCGGHFRTEHQTEDGEAKRDDDNFAYVAAWEYAGEGKAPILQQGAAHLRERPPEHAELQVSGSSTATMN